MCCAPCSIYPLRRLEDQGYDVMGFFYRHNIHPYSECLKRQETLEAYAESKGFRLICQPGYDLEGFIRNVAFREKDRCSFCYFDRLQATARLAKRGKFDFFSTTLLYSKFQNHEMIRSMGESIAGTVGVKFYYQDFRKGWKEGIETSKRLGMYRQPYCGCIYSEKERYYRSQKGSNDPS
jgi:predicted adenine nucleotide alpha hydrolase (AANH) superfamily ATPase